MKTRFLLFAVFLLVCSTAFSQEADNAKYIEVTGTSEITLVPDEIHYLIEIKEYWEEEFDGKSKPENYRTIGGSRWIYVHNLVSSKRYRPIPRF